MEIEIAGVLTHVLDKVVYGKTDFTKREFIIKTQGEYPQDIKFEVHGEKNADNLVQFNKVGDNVLVKFNIRGKLFTNKDGIETAYPSLVAWRVEKNSEVVNEEVKEEVEDDLPF